MDGPASDRRDDEDESITSCKAWGRAESGGGAKMWSEGGIPVAAVSSLEGESENAADVCADERAAAD